MGERRLQRASALALALALTACGEAPTSSGDGESALTPPEDLATGLELAAEGFGLDPYAIGSDWYDYDGATHAVTPSDHVYALRRGEVITLLEVESYYDDRGESGVFSLRAREGGGEVEALTLDTNVKEEPGCVALSPLRQVSCDDSDAALILRTVWRAIPDGGFAVREPGLYVMSHFTDAPEQHIEVVRLGAGALEEVDEAIDVLRERTPHPDASHAPELARVGWVHAEAGAAPRRDLHLQVTAHMKLVQWQIAALREGDGEIELDLKIACQRVDFEEQAPFSEEHTATRTLSLPAGEGFHAALVSLCPSREGLAPRGEIIDARDTPWRGRWPDTRDFDLIVEVLDGRVAARITPGNLLWNWTRGAGEGDDTWRLIDTADVWEAYTL